MSFSDIIYPFEWLVAWIMYLWHGALTTIGLPEASGWTWTLSIVGLVLVMRAALIPLFVKQIHASRKMQLIQPEMAKIQAKYKGKNDPDSRQKMTEETMALYKDSGTNPFASCLPIIAQMPFFFGLFRVLNNLDEIGSGARGGIGPITQQVAAQAESSSIFGAPLSAQFLGTDGGLSVKIVTVTLIILMSLTTFTTQYQLMRKNMPAAALEGQFAQQQKIMLYLFPIIFAVSGVYFPIGVLIYWFTTNVWTMCQQFYVIRRMPAPGSAAEKAMQDRRRKAGKPLDTPEETRERAHDAEMAEQLQSKGVISGQRQQPTSKKRAKKKGGTPPKSGRASAVDEQKPTTDN